MTKYINPESFDILYGYKKFDVLGVLLKEIVQESIVTFFTEEWLTKQVILPTVKAFSEEVAVESFDMMCEENQDKLFDLYLEKLIHSELIDEAIKKMGND